MKPEPTEKQTAVGAVPPLEWQAVEGLAGMSLEDLLSEAGLRLRDLPHPQPRPLVRRLAEYVEQCDTWLEDPANRFSLAHVRQLLGTYVTWRRERPDPRGATFLELGCGAENPLAVSAAMLLLGAERAFGVDDSPILDEARAVRAVSRVVNGMLSDPASLVDGFDVPPADVLDRLRGFDLVKIARGDGSGIDSERLAYRRESIDAIALPDKSCDITSSSAVLEHVSLRDTARELGRLSRPGAWSIHNVDYNDHGIYDGAARTPISFLTEQPDATHVRTCNRARHSEVIAAFRDAGFDLVEEAVYERQEPDPAVLGALLPRFRDLPPDDLRITRAVLAFRKRG